MKKITLLSIFCCLCLSVSAQSKKELAEKISALETKVTELNARVEAQFNQTNTLILTLTQQLGALQTENASLKERLETDNALLKERLGKLENSPVEKKGQVPDVLVTQADSLQYIILKYRMSKTPEEASQYIYDVARVKPIMLKFYKEPGDWKPFNGYSDGGLWKDNWTTAVKLNDKLYMLDDWYLVKTPTGYKIDWEANVQYNMFAPAYDYLKTNGQINELRGRCYRYEDSDGWVRFSFDSSTTDDMYVYGKKSSAKTQELLDYLKSNTRPVILKVKCKATPYGGEIYNMCYKDKYLELVDIVSKNCSKVK